MKLNQIELGKSYRGPGGVVRSVVEKKSTNEVFYLEDAHHLIFSAPGQEFATWAKTFWSPTDSHREYFAREKSKKQQRS